MRRPATDHDNDNDRGNYRAGANAAARDYDDADAFRDGAVTLFVSVFALNNECRARG